MNDTGVPGGTPATTGGTPVPPSRKAATKELKTES